METLQNKVKELKKLSWSEVKKLKFNQLKNNSDRDIAKLKKSILNRGFFSPFMVWNEFVFDGAGRLQALKELEREGLEIPNLPCLFVEANNLAEAKIYALQMSSKHTQESLYEFTVDIPEVETLINEVDFYEFNMEFGEVEELEPKAEEDDFEVPKEIQTDIVRGDIFEFRKGGKTLHRLMCGDSTSVDDVEKLMGGEKADMVLTDPPYNVSYQGKTKKALTIENDSMSNDSFYKFLYDFYSALTTAVKKGGVIYVWHSSSEVINFGKAMVDAGWLLKQQLIWVNNSMVMGRQDYQWKHEPCLYGWLTGGSHKWYSDRKQTTVIEFDRPNRNGEHPTMKPVGLFAYQIENSSKLGDLVIDGFLGSGSTMVASHQLNRRCYGMELDEKYTQVIIDRMKKLDPELEIIKV